MTIGGKNWGENWNENWSENWDEIFQKRKEEGEGKSCVFEKIKTV